MSPLYDFPALQLLDTIDCTASADALAATTIRNGFVLPRSYCDFAQRYGYGLLGNRLLIFMPIHGYGCDFLPTRSQELSDFFGADRIVTKCVAPLPHLVVPAFPVRLNDELVLDRLTDDEVTRCYQVGVIRPTSLRFPLIYGETAVGIRRTVLLPKLLRRGDEPPELPATEDEGSFGRRPYSRADLVTGDVLSALRLFKRTQIRTAGLASWTDAPWLAGATEYQVLGRWPYGGSFELSEGEVPQLLQLWHLLEEGGATRFRFSIHRFNLAFERGLLDWHALVLRVRSGRVELFTAMDRHRRCALHAR